MLSERSLLSIQKAPADLKKPVRVVLFTTDAACPACPDMVELGRALKKKFVRIALEIYDAVMDRDKAEQYGVTLVPTIVVQNGGGQSAAFCGMIEDEVLDALLRTIIGLAEAKTWLPDATVRALRHLTQDVKIRVFVEADCKQCVPVIETAVGLALTSGNIYTDIIVASDFPDLIKKYRITTLPKTVFGENLHLDGHVTESEFIEMVFQAEGIEVGPDRRCILCGKASADAICLACKNKVEAEARDHKLKSQKTGQ